MNMKQMGTIMVLLITMFLGFGIIIPLVPEILEGNNSIHLGLMLALYSAASFIMSPIWGGLSDKYGRKPILLIGTIGFSISFYVFAIGLDSLTLMYLSRILGGLFSGAVIACAVAYVADITTDETRTRGMGLVGMSIGLGFVFGPPIGGLLSTISYAFPFYASSILTVLLFFFVLAYIKEPVKQKKEKEEKGKQSKRQRYGAAVAGPMKYLYILGFVVSFTLAGVEATFQFYQIVKIGATPAQVGIMLGASGLLGALIQGGIVRRIKPGKESQFIMLGLILTASGFFLILLSNNVFTAGLYLCVFGAGNALLRPCITSLITKKTKVEYGVATGLSSSMDSLGRIVGPVLGTLLFDWKANLPFIVFGVITITAVLIVLQYRKYEKLDTLQAAA
ncbi:MFS transporter [Longirhabdus pacifica]|uniref:MFS transporter n=1 Tax=Longirhabdus pacifica TaxID=2305227 RepID=UPI001008E18A|nr:MFS transporter [Longirhabdus pacifica]